MSGPGTVNSAIVEMINKECKDDPDLARCIICLFVEETTHPGMWRYASKYRDLIKFYANKRVSQK
jgi:hypothetical protein